jgi:hypothetical protein
MPANPDDPNSEPQDALSQIARLRAQVEALMREKIAPVVADATGRAGAAAQDAGDALRTGADELAGAIRRQPLTAILLIAAMGFLLGRASR